MMIEANHMRITPWIRIEQLCQDTSWDIRTYNNQYVVRRQKVYTPGHTVQLHITPVLSRGTDYKLTGSENCWEITVCNDLRHGRLLTVHTYHPNATFAMLSEYDGKECCKYILEHERNPAARRELETRFAHHIIHKIFG